MLSAIKNFAVTFVIAAVVFGTIGYFATRFVTATVNDILDNEISALDDILSAESETDSSTENAPDTTTPDISGNAQTLSESSSFSFIIVCSGYRPEIFGDYLPDTETLRNQIAGYVTAADSFGVLSKHYRDRQATSITLVRADKERQEFTYTYISPETRIYSSSGYHTLGEIYELYGYTYIDDYVNALTGIAVDYTFLMDGYNFDEFLNLLGTVYVNNPKDIYSDGTYHTTWSGYSVERVNEDGETVTDQFSSSLVLSSGYIEFNEYASNIMNTLKERSSADVDTKGKFTVELVQAYLQKLADMDLETFRTTMHELIVLSEAESATKTWNADGSISEEPATPILETNFTEEDIDSVYDMIHAATQFSSTVITYPGNYITETDTHDAYFEPDIETAVKQFASYRFINGDNP